MCVCVFLSCVYLGPSASFLLLQWVVNCTGDEIKYQSLEFKSLRRIANWASVSVATISAVCWLTITPQVNLKTGLFLLKKIFTFC